MEHVNTGTTKLNLVSTLQDHSGVAQTPVTFSLKTGYQYDLLVHGLPGFQANRYGLICSTASNGQPGDLDGRMVFYKPDAATGGYQFAFAMPLGNGLIGTQFVPYNTYQPSLDPVDSSNLAANWIQLTNLSTAKPLRSKQELGLTSLPMTLLDSGKWELCNGHQLQLPPDSSFAMLGITTDQMG